MKSRKQNSNKFNFNIFSKLEWDVDWDMVSIILRESEASKETKVQYDPECLDVSFFQFFELLMKIKFSVGSSKNATINGRLSRAFKRGD